MKKTIVFGVIVLAVAGGAFFGGMQYNAAQAQTKQAAYGAQSGTRGGFRSGGRGGANGMSGFTSGQIISNDNGTITVNMRDGSSKLVLFSDTTQITKSVPGTKDDLAVGKMIMVMGDANKDGSVSAKTIQVRPDMPPTQSGQNAPSGK